MDLKELLLLEKLSFGIISLTGSLVVLLGLGLYVNVSSSNPYKDLANQPAVVSNRAPASLPDVTAATSKVEEIPVVATASKELRTFDLDCQGHLVKAVREATNVKVEQIRLRRTKCGDDISKTAIVNASNGYVATLFNTNAEQLSSDYIHLTEGENIIRVTFQDRLGVSHTSELSFSRSLAAQ